MVDGYGPSKCDGKYHDNSDERVVALSTGWYAGGSRCGITIYIQANGKSTTAKVVDECDSTRGCDDEHRRPCGYNIVGGSKAVWKALDIDRDEEEVNIVWSVL
ncbi:Ripening-related protein grip22 [Ranunculus cassubicifolius]